MGKEYHPHPSGNQVFGPKPLNYRPPYRPDNPIHVNVAYTAKEVRIEVQVSGGKKRLVLDSKILKGSVPTAMVSMTVSEMRRRARLKIEKAAKRQAKAGKAAHELEAFL